VADLPRYWTPEFTEVLVEALNADPAFQKAARKFDDTLIMQCFDTPDGKDMRIVYRIERGRVTTDVTVEDAPSRTIRDAPFDAKRCMARCTAPYSIWTRLDRGEMNVLQALASPDYSIEGPKLKIMRHVRVLDAMSAVASRLPKRH